MESCLSKQFLTWVFIRVICGVFKMSVPRPHLPTIRVESLGVSFSVNVYSVKTLFHPIDCSPPGSSVYGIFQARILEWVSVSSSRRSS